MSQQLSRRQLLRFAGSSVLVGSAAAISPIPDSPRAKAIAHAAAPMTSHSSTTSLSDDPTLHLLRRITFGITPELLAQVQAIGIDAFLDEQLSPQSLDDSELDARLAQFPTLTMSNAEIVARHRMIRAERKARRNAAVAGASMVDNEMLTDTVNNELMLGQGTLVDDSLALDELMEETLVDDELINLFISDIVDDEDEDAESSEALLEDADMMIMGAASTQTHSAAVELIAATQLRALYSKRQLFELMVDFWNNHFNMHIAVSRVAFYKSSDDQNVIRAHALGRFADMLKASAQSPAMLVYLDNARSKRQSPNENYARELMELHTLGVNGGYTEVDVRNAAYLLTGWSVGRNHEFAFKRGRHHREALQIMDWSTAGSNGQAAIDDGLNFLDYLAHHPATANHLAHKLCVRFVGDTPPAELVQEVAAAYLANDTAIEPMLRTLFAHSAFWDAATVGQKFRRPFEQMTAMLRAVEANIARGSELKSARFLHGSLRVLGQPHFGWPAPDGYPDQRDDWLSEAGLLARWNFTQKFVRGARKKATRTKRGISIDFLGILENPSPQTAGEFVDGMAARILHQPVGSAERDTLLGYLGMGESDAISAKELAYKAPQLAALILNSPNFQYR